MTLPKNSEAPPDSVAQDQIKAFVDRIIRLREEGRAIKGDEKEVYAEAKGNGFDKTVLGKLVLHVERQADADKATAAAEQDALLDLYIAAYYGSAPSHTHAHAREGETIPGNGAGGTEEVASVATYGAASSDNSSRADEVVSNDLASRQPSPAGVEGEADRQPILAETPNEKVGGFPVPAAPLSRGGTGGQDQAENMIDDRGGEGTPSSSHAATVVTLQFRTHNPDTHFLSSDGLLRLHGCQKPELCASGQPRLKLCFACSVAHDGPTHGEVA